MNNQRMVVAIVFILLIAGYAVYKEQQKNQEIAPLLKELEAKLNK